MNGHCVMQWNFYLSTTSVDGLSTTTTAALTVLGSNGNVGIGSTTPYATLSIVGQNPRDTGYGYSSGAVVYVRRESPEVWLFQKLVVDSSERCMHHIHLSGRGREHELLFTR